jgi:putative ABC transport system permease protein
MSDGRVSLFGSLWQDLRFALRTLRTNPGFAVAAVFVLALGIGANTAIFSVMNAVLLNPVPFKAIREPERLVMIWERNPSMSAFLANRMPVRLKDFREWQTTARSFDRMAIFKEVGFNLTEQADTGNRKPEHVDAAEASADLFPLFGVQPRLGRNFKSEEMQEGKRDVAMISDDLYRRRFNNDPDILRKTLRADGQSYRIIGVLPPGFALPAMWGGFDQKKVDMWVPINMHPAGDADQQFVSFVYARLKPGATLDEARAEMQIVQKRLEKTDPVLGFFSGINVSPVREEDAGPELRTSIFVLQAAVIFVLLIACANVGNLLLTRAVVREKEMAVRIALGAGRWRLIRQLLSESLLLSGLAGVFGVIFAFWALRIISHYAAAGTHGFHELRIDYPVLFFTLGVTVAAGVLFGLAPSSYILKQDVNQSLNRGARSIAGTSNRLRGALVISEVALSLILLIGAGLMIRSLSALMSTDLGFRLDHLHTMQISLPQSKYFKPEQVTGFNDRLLGAVRQIPGVKAASLTTAIPMQTVMEGSYELPDRKLKPNQHLVSNWARVSDGYFETLGMQVYQGRTFTRADVTSKNPAVAVVNRAFARSNWPHGDALGKVIVFGNEARKNTDYRIVGIVNDEHQLGPDSDSHAEFYLPGQRLQLMYLVVRAAGSPLQIASAVKKEVWNIDREQPISEIRNMEDVLREWTGPRRFNMTVLLDFAAIALVLAAVGLYSVLAYSVSLRTREISIRVALGAEPRKVARFVVNQGLKLTLVGVVLGLAGAFALTQFIQSLIYGVSAMDPVTFVAVPFLLVVVAVAASYLPARRASRIDPIEALRVE